MILQYKNKLRNSWVYEEVDSIESFLMDFKELLDSGLNEYDLEQKYKSKISYETNIDNVTIVSTKLEGISTLTVVKIKSRDNVYIKAFTTTDIYLLNNEGKTISRI